MFRILTTLAVMSASITTASAQWMAQRAGGEFDETPTYVAVTVVDDYAIGFRCGPDELKVIFLTPEVIKDPDDVEAMNAASVKLRLRIDNGDIIVLDGDVHEVKGKLGILADVDLDLLRSVSAAKSKFSAVMTMLGKNYHETTFNLRGSKRAIDEIVANCKLAQ